MRVSVFARSTAALALTAALAACGGVQQGPQVQSSRPQPQDLSVRELGTPITLQAASAEYVDETPQNWFVELGSAPVADGGSLAETQTDKRNFRAAATKAGAKFTERRSFDKLFNGLSVRASAGEVAKLARVEGVRAVYPVERIAMPETTVSSTPDIINASTQTGVDIAHSQLGLTGRGVKVAVMDTGIDLDHPAFKGRVPYGYDFVGDAYNAASTDPANLVPHPDENPDDCGGHGSHVAGIVGGNDAAHQVVGVAPEVTFGAYRVFGCEGSTDADIMIAAMERALDDGMQVLNMSIGSAYQWPEYPTAKAASRLVNKGMVVVASIGNNGANGAFAAGAPGLGDKVIGVASFDNVRLTKKQFMVDGRGYLVNEATGAPVLPTSGELPLTKTGTPTTVNDACAALPANSLDGQAVLIRRGTCAFYVKALNAQKAGAKAVVLYNSQPGDLSPTVVGAEAITIPVVIVSKTDGEALDARINTGATTLSFTDQLGSAPNPTADTISSFSSYGLSPDLTLKPDIGAPGGSIYSAYPLEKGGYATLSGTSMASPHVAGMAALLLQAKPNTPAQAVRTIFQNTAVPKAWWGDPKAGYLDQVHRQGAGMANIVRAVTGTTRVEPSKLSLGESQQGPATRSLTIENDGNAPVTYTLSHVAALATGGNTNAPKTMTGPATVSFSVPSVTVPAGGSATVSVTVTANSALADRSQYGGYVVLTDEEGSVVARVPYAGFKGDYQSVQVLVPTSSNFPWLSKLNGASYLKQGAGATFSLKDGDLPYVVAHFEHQSRLLRGEVYDAASGRYLGRAFTESYLGRNGTPTGVFGFAFDGSVTQGKQVRVVPDGRYLVKLTVLKALGDENNAADWETWTSPEFTIKRR